MTVAKQTEGSNIQYKNDDKKETAEELCSNIVLSCNEKTGLIKKKTSKV